MKFSEYTALAGETAIYPNRGANLAYVALGLADEAGEVLEHAIMSATADNAAERAEVGPKVLKEAGDVLWYASQVCFEAGIHPDIVVDELGEAGGELRKQWPMPREWAGSVSFMRLCGSLSIATSRVAGLAKKAIRDDGGALTPDRRAKISTLVAEAILLLAMIVHVVSAGEKTLAYAADLNLEKLGSRKERGVLTGSGDDR